MWLLALITSTTIAFSNVPFGTFKECREVKQQIIERFPQAEDLLVCTTDI